MTLQKQAEAVAPEVRRALLAWYRRYARDLPWRRTRDPYCLWLSEIMLQQTRVETAVPYYLRFVEVFPSVSSLAAGSQDEVLKLWEGLGYYSRARHLHRAAKHVAHGLEGRLPETAAELQRLPGIGRYTAGAVASIAFGECVPALDGNVKRVLARVFAVRESIDDTATTANLWAAAGALVSRRSPGNFNQALMELGAQVCTPKRPHCGTCPVSNLCAARKTGDQETLPLRRSKKSVPRYEVVAALVRREESLLLAQRPEDVMLGGLWELPGGKVLPGESPEEALRRELQEKLGVEANVGAEVATVRHGYSHFSIELRVYRCDLGRHEPMAREHVQLRWIGRDEWEACALPVSTKKALAQIDRRGGETE